MYQGGQVVENADAMFCFENQMRQMRAYESGTNRIQTRLLMPEQFPSAAERIWKKLT